VGGRLVGLISLRSIERWLAAQPDGGDTPVADLMKTELVTVTPDTPTLKAIALARKHKISCLPVVRGEHIVALLNRSHFVGRWAKVLEQEERVHATKEPV
jgi:CBS domain-containing protein